MWLSPQKEGTRLGFKRFSIKTTGVTSLVLTALVYWGVAPAAAAAPGAGAFVGAETAPTSFTTYPPLNITPLCAEYLPSSTGPLVENLSFTGTFNGLNIVPPFGTATLTDTGSKYDASPLGTFAPGTNCSALTVGFPVSGSWTASIPVLGGTTYACSGTTGTYVRVQSAIVITLTGTCSPSVGTVTFTFTGTEVPCLPLPCNPGPPYPAGDDAITQGAYVQT